MAVASLWTLFLVLYLVSATPDRPGHLEPLGRSGTMEPLHERVGFIPPKEFINDYVLQNRPVVMRRAILDSPAISKWTDDYLVAKAKANPEASVTVEFAKKETRLTGGNMPFDEFLGKYNTTDMYMVSGMPEYLEEDMIIPWSLQCEDFKRSFEDNVMWFSSGGTKSVIHHDGFENINCLIRGKKRFLFVNTTRYKEVERKIIDYMENGSYGSVDVEKVDLDKYPVYEGMQFFNADLNPGDCVYSAYQWIHQVESWESNIAVNMWWFREINSIINQDQCSASFDHSRTFKTANFHKTTILEDGANMDEKVVAYRNSLARLVFKTAKKDSVKLIDFIRILTGNRKKVSRQKDYTRTAVDLFRYIDSNGNKKFDVGDMEKEVSEDEIEGFYQVMVTWTSTARIHDFPEVLDLRYDAYKSVPAFTADELNLKTETPLKQADSVSEGKLDEKPVLQDVQGSSLGDRDEL